MNTSKERIKFKNQKVFGRLFDPFIDSAISFVGKMYIAGKIDNTGKIIDASLSQLWSYVYYLYYYNKTHEPFDKMKTLTGNHASARNFYKIVHEYTSTSGKIDETILKKFINIIVSKYDLNNPILKGSIMIPKSNKQNLEEFQNEIQKLKEYLAIAQKELKDCKKISIKKQDCSNETREFKQLCKNLEHMITSKMCILKYLGDIMRLTTSPPKHKCDSDVSQQILAFDKLSTLLKFKYKELYQKNRKDVLKLLDTYSSLYTMNIKCEHLKTFQKQYETDLIKYNSIIGDLQDLYEDLYGKVRIYIKVRKFMQHLDDPSIKAQINITDHTKITLECNKITTVGNYFGAFGPEFTNADLYSGLINTKVDGLKIKQDDIKPWSLSKTFNQLERGYSICLLSMGLSGSSKTYTLFGNHHSPGLVNYALANLSATNNIEYVFELYYDFININEKEISGKVIIVYDRPKDLDKHLNKYGVTNLEYENIKLNESNIEESIKIITDNQVKQGRVKKTLNNPTSSRSHLFIVFKVGSSYLTIIDLAGIENAFQIYQDLFKNKMSIPYFLLQFDSEGMYKGQLKHEKIEKYITGHGIQNGDTILNKNDNGKLIFKNTSKIEDTLQKNVQILLESFFIVETLNHMQYYFNNSLTFEFQSIFAGTIQYKTSRVFVNPSNEKNRVLHKQIYMIPLLDFINDLGSKETMSKFILFGFLRPDKCDTDTLKYLNKI
jgi:hypothetical protein